MDKFSNELEKESRIYIFVKIYSTLYCIFNEFDRNILVDTFLLKKNVECFEDKFTRIFFFNITKNYALIKIYTYTLIQLKVWRIYCYRL